MSTYTQFFSDTFEQETLIHAVFSAPLKQAQTCSRVDIRAIDTKKGLLYQVSRQVGAQVFHTNLTGPECQQLILGELLSQFQQAVIFTTQGDVYLTLSDGAIKVRQKPASKQATTSKAHNRQKNYLVQSDTSVPYLVALEIMGPTGNIYPKKMAKYRQINRFVEMVADVLTHLPSKAPLRVIDFGCGKSYLTFALYDYLHRICGRDVDMLGLDLKETVVATCQQLADRLQFKGLQFQLGDIGAYHPTGTIDLVVALHACDTATDAAIAVAVRGQAKAILAAPCCQHELNAQVHCESLDALLQYGLLKERFAALATDAARATLLEASGYHTQILEFIDSEHTPKNLLIRAVKGNTSQQREQAALRYAVLKGHLAIQPCLEKMIRP